MQKECVCGRPAHKSNRHITKILMFMKLTFVLLTVGLLNVSATGVSQTVSFSGEGVSLKSVFLSVKKQTGFVFLYTRPVLESAKPVTVSAEGMPLEEFLQRIFKTQPLKYSIKGKSILVSPKPAPAPQTGSGREADFLKDTLRDVKGKIVDEQGEPVAGASIMIKNEKRGTTSDRVGEFELNRVAGNSVLLIRFIGYESREVAVSGSSYYTITLRQTETSLKDVVVTGLFARKRESFTGATATYSSKDLLEVGNANIVRSLANLDPSFRVLENLEFGSDPNRLPDIQLRGQTGLPDLNNEYGSNPNLPLFILDGFETTLQRVIDLDMYLVKSVTLLKDAASKSVYGSRAANGVVVIETKMPPPGKLQFTYNYNLNLEAPDLSSYDLTNAREKLDVELAANPVLNQEPALGTDLYETWMAFNRKFQQVERGVNTYWLSQPLRNGVGQRHSFMVGGGTPEFRYNVELGYNNIAGVMKGSGRKVYSGGATLSYRFKKVSVSNILRLSSAKSSNSPYGSFRQFALLNPYEDLYDSTGGFARANPMWNGNVGVRDFGNTNLLSNNLEFIWQPLTALRISGRLGISSTGSETNVFLPATHNSFPLLSEPGGTGSNPTGISTASYGSYTRARTDEKKMNTTFSASYNKILGDHTIYANIGGDANETVQEGYGFKVTGFPNPRLDFPAAAIRYADNSKLTGAEIRNRDMGMYSSVNYAFKERYLVDATIRATRSSQFGKNDPWGKFWSAGIGWNLHREPFIRSLGVFNRLRLTANTGFTGTQALITYATLPSYSYNFAETYFGLLATSLQGLANPDLRAQRRQDNNISLNASLLDNDLDIGIDYYISNTDGLLTDLNLPYSNGFSSYKANLGRAENRGFDIRLNYRKRLSAAKDQFISFFLTAGHNKNTLKEISTSLIAFTNKQDAIDSRSPKVRFAEGQSLNAIWAVRSLGIDPTTGKEVFLKQDGTSTFLWDVADQVVAGEGLPDVFGNFGFSFRMNGWQFSTSFAYNFGGQKYNQTLVDKVENASIATENVDRRIFTSRWRQPGDVTLFKSIADLGTTYPTTRFVQDWNEVSIASLNLSYDLERINYIRQLGIKRLRASLVANNPLVFSSVQVERGTDYPFARTFSFSLQTNF